MSQHNEMPAPDAMSSLFPPGFLKVVGFLIPANETTRELITWYEEIHAPTASFLWPHMDVYRRNFIMEVESGPVPPYRVVTEFIWKSDDDKRAAAALFATPAAEATINEQYPAWMKPLDIPQTHGLVPVDSFEIAAPSERRDTQTAVRRRIVLLDQHPQALNSELDIAAQNYAKKIAQAFGVEVSIDMCRQSAIWPTTRAVIYIDDATHRALPDIDGGVLKIANIFSVETRKSPI